jgi:hypothetical protein
VIQLRNSDFYLSRFAHRAPTILKLLGDVETDFLRPQTRAIHIDRPVFITGLARSGTTILLNLFSSLPKVGTHRYRDYPFLFVPHAWNRFQDRMAAAQAPVERPHKDRIQINRDSPEAFEEPIWMHFFPFVHDAASHHVLGPAHDNTRFNSFYREHLRKILLVRGASRYVSKGNYNVARVHYIARLLPDARFVIPVRHPVTHVASLLRQHELFTGYSAGDSRLPEYLRAAGHYEFGPQRAPINLDDEATRRILEAWSRGEDDLGYAVMWRTVYAHVRQLTGSGTALAGRIKVVRYEDLCMNAPGTLRELFEFCELTEGVEELLENLPEISAPKRLGEVLQPAQRERVWNETAALAECFGYRP